MVVNVNFNLWKLPVLVQCSLPPSPSVCLVESVAAATPEKSLFLFTQDSANRFQKLSTLFQIIFELTVTNCFVVSLWSFQIVVNIIEKESPGHKRLTYKRGAQFLPGLCSDSRTVGKIQKEVWVSDSLSISMYKHQVESKSDVKECLKNRDLSLNWFQNF